jgi:hypothetical protein
MDQNLADNNPLLTDLKVCEVVFAGHDEHGVLSDRVFNDLMDDFTKSDFKSFYDDFEIF